MNQSKVGGIYGILKEIPDEEGISSHPLGVKSGDGDEEHCTDEESIIGGGVIPYELDEDPPGNGNGGADEKQIAEYVEGQSHHLFYHLRLMGQPG